MGLKTLPTRKTLVERKLSMTIYLDSLLIKVGGGLGFCCSNYYLILSLEKGRPYETNFFFFSLSLFSPVTGLASEIFSFIRPEALPFPLSKSLALCMGIVNLASSHEDKISFDYSHSKPAVTVLGNIKSPLYDIVYKRVKGHALTCKSIE